MTKQKVIREVVGTLVVVTILAIFGWIGMTIAYGQTEPDENQVAFWCDNGGIKIEDPGTPFVVPEPPPEGSTWVLLVLKAGTQDATFPNPISGQSVSHPSGKEISHAILCYSEANGTPSTTTSTTTGTTPTTSTTTTVPATTTSSSAPNSTTTTGPPSSSSVPPSPSSTVPPTIPTPKGVNAGEAPIGAVQAGGGSTAGVLCGGDWQCWAWIAAAWAAGAGLAWAFVAGGTRRHNG